MHARTPRLLRATIVSLLGLFATSARAEPAPAAPHAESAAPAAPEALAPAAPPAVALPPPPPPPAPVVSYAPAPGYGTATNPRVTSYDGPPLLLGRRAHVGGYGGFSAAYTRMLDRDGALLGFEGALLLAHRLSLGLAGYGFLRSPAGPPDLAGTPRELSVGYGGFVARYAFLTHLPVYASVGLLLGGGAVVLHPEDEDGDHDWEDDGRDETDAFFVAQPELSLHANLTRWMRLGATAGYRVTSSVHRFGLQTSDLNGVVVGGHLQFGWI